MTIREEENYDLVSSQQAKDIGPTWATNGYLYGSYMGNP